MRALVTGATGFLGSRLIARLMALDSSLVLLSRDAGGARRKLGALAEGRSAVDVHAWDPVAGPPPAEALAGVHVVFHLAGDPVADGRWTTEKKQRIRASRELGTRNLVQALRSMNEPRPGVLVSASAVGYYGTRGDEILDETAASGAGFLAEVCRAWEAEALAARDLGMRVVTPRIGVVLGRGGALEAMLPPFRLGLGAHLGRGDQWMSWIHVDDLVALLIHAATHDEISGPINATAPTPATNRDFTDELAATLGHRARLGVPTIALRLALGEKAEVVLGSQRAVPRVAERTGFGWTHPDLAEALRSILRE